MTTQGDSKVGESDQTAMTKINGKSFRRAVVRAASPVDLAAITAVVLVLVVVFLLPASTREQFVFERGNPAVRTAYLSHFVHRQQLHLLGNLAVYLAVAPVTYLLCILSDRRQLFRGMFVTLLGVFPFALSGMQLLFPRQREVLGFSGLNAGLFGLLCVAWVAYIGHQFLETENNRYAPALLFVLSGVIALITLPGRAWRLQIGAASISLGIGYVTLWVRRGSHLQNAALRERFDRFGYAELAGAGLGLIVSYPFIGFREIVTLDTGVLDVYIHLLGFSLSFIVVFVYVELTE